MTRRRGTFMCKVSYEAPWQSSERWTALDGDAPRENSACIYSVFQKHSFDGRVRNGGEARTISFLTFGPLSDLLNCE